MESRFLFEADNLFPRHSEGSMIQTPSGKLLFSWSRFEDKRYTKKGFFNGITSDGSRKKGILESDNDRASIMSVTSYDFGLTWAEQTEIMTTNEGLNVMSPAYSVLQDGSLGMVYSNRKSVTEAGRLFIRSFDEGKTWSKPTRITHEGYMTGCHDRFTTLRNGRLLVPLHCSDNWYNHYLHVRVALSDDIGETWQIGDPIVLPKVEHFAESGLMEPGIVELKTGNLMMILRTAEGTIYRIDSIDAGESWRDLRSTGVRSPIAPAIVRRLNDEALIMLWNDNFEKDDPMGGKRTPLVLGVSKDDGESWPESLRFELENDGKYAYSYPSCLVTDQSLLVTYNVSSLRDQYGKRSLKLLMIDKQELQK